MIAIKVIIFFLAMWLTFAFIEDVIEKIILHNKKDADELDVLYTTGILSTFDGFLWICVLVIWTAFYFVNQL
jgi:hypothetical protein